MIQMTVILTVEMKELQRLVTGHSPTIPLFTKLRQKKVQPIHGVPMVDSDDEQLHSPIDLTSIIEQLRTYKMAQAREVARNHLKTKQPIQEIVEKSKERYRREAIAIIEANIASSNQVYESKQHSQPKQPKDIGSTLPGSERREEPERGEVETPAFDLPSGGCEMTIDLRQFTLGQKDDQSEERRRQERNSPGVSQFQVREPSSKRIKDRIMNSQRGRK